MSETQDLPPPSELSIGGALIQERLSPQLDGWIVETQAAVHEAPER